MEALLIVNSENQAMQELIDYSPAGCPACGSPDASPYVSGDRDPHREIRGAYTYYLCGSCRLRYRRVTFEEAIGLYADVEDKVPSPSGRRPLHCDEDVLRAFRKLDVGSRLLDVGAGDGRFLAAARSAGFQCLGTDVSERLVETARARSGAEVLLGDLADLRLGRESFDLINLDQVLMYIARPRRLLVEVASLLRPGGICRIREYDPDSLRARMAGKRYWMYGATNVNLWTRQSIRALAYVAGLEVYRILPGTEASLSAWLAAGSRRDLRGNLSRSLGFLTRKVQLPGVSIGADTVYYLRKSTRKMENPLCNRC